MPELLSRLCLKGRQVLGGQAGIQHQNVIHPGEHRTDCPSGSRCTGTSQQGRDQRHGCSRQVQEGDDLNEASYIMNRTGGIGSKFAKPLFEISNLVEQPPSCWTNIARQTQTQEIRDPRSKNPLGFWPPRQSVRATYVNSLKPEAPAKEHRGFLRSCPLGASESAATR